MPGESAHSALSFEEQSTLISADATLYAGRKLSVGLKDKRGHAIGRVSVLGQGNRFPAPRFSSIGLEASNFISIVPGTNARTMTLWPC